jgi:hypothetical protein
MVVYQLGISWYNIHHLPAWYSLVYLGISHIDQHLGISATSRKVYRDNITMILKISRVFFEKNNSAAQQDADSDTADADDDASDDPPTNPEETNPLAGTSGNTSNEAYL